MEDLYSLNDAKEATTYLKKMYALSATYLDKYKKVTGDTENKITENFLGIDQCYLKIHNLNILKFSYKSYNTDEKSKPFISFNNILERTRENFNKCLNLVIQNLSKLAEALKPDSFKEDEKIIESLISSKEKISYIYPEEGNIILSTIYNLGDKKLIFSTEYSEKSSAKYLNVLAEDCIPGKYNIGKEIQDSIEEEVNFLLYSKDSFKDLILYSNFESPFIKIILKDNLNIKNICNSLTDYFKAVLKSSRIVNGNILLAFNNLKKKDFYMVSSVLKLKPNDIHNFLSTIEEC